MARQLAPIPKITEQDGHATDRFKFWLLDLIGVTQASSYAPLTIPAVTAQTAAIGTTSLYTVGNAGVYRVSWALRITTAGSISSSVTVTIGHTEATLAITQAGAAVTGNTTTTVQSGSVICRPDAATPITYSTAYASNAAGAAYSVTFVVESIG